jgi:hypothetical protein
MRTFGRACRGKSKGLVQLVRQTERHLLEMGPEVEALCLSACLELAEDTCLDEALRQHLETHLHQAEENYRKIAAQSRRLVHGKKLPHAKIVNAYDPSIAPILKGKSNCPAQFGKKPGIVAEMATGFIFGLHLPEGNPDDASYMLPLLDQVDKSIARMEKPRKPGIVSVCADLALNRKEVRDSLQKRGILTVGIPQTIDPLPPKPTPQQIQAVQQQITTGPIPTARQIQTAFACGYSRPFIESLIETLSCRGAGQIKYKGHRGAILQVTAATLACNGATLVRIQQGRLSKRAQKFRRFFRLKPPNLLQLVFLQK